MPALTQSWGVSHERWSTRPALEGSVLPVSHVAPALVEVTVVSVDELAAMPRQCVGPEQATASRTPAVGSGAEAKTWVLPALLSSSGWVPTVPTTRHEVAAQAASVMDATGWIGRVACFQVVPASVESIRTELLALGLNEEPPAVQIELGPHEMVDRLPAKNGLADPTPELAASEAVDEVAVVEQAPSAMPTMTSAPAVAMRRRDEVAGTSQA